MEYHLIHTSHLDNYVVPTNVVDILAYLLSIVRSSMCETEIKYFEPLLLDSRSWHRSELRKIENRIIMLRLQLEDSEHREGLYQLYKCLEKLDHLSVALDSLLLINC
jgi:hypothetical protein